MTMKKKMFLRRSVALLLGLLMLLSSFGALISCSPDKKPSESQEDGVLYTVTLKTRGGLLMSDTGVELSDADGKVVASGKTDANGSYSVRLSPARYTVRVTDLKLGYSAPEAVTSDAGGETVIIADTAVINEELPSDKVYAVGDVMYDFTFLRDGAEVKLSELLAEKKLVLLNFWASWCGPCKSEFPAFESTWREYGDDIEIVAMSTDDNAAQCASFKSSYEYTFNMVPDLNGSFYGHFISFHGGSIPCTVFIDRYGIITEYVKGGNSDAEIWKEAVEHYISDDYVQTSPSDGDDGKDDVVEIEKPNVDMPASSEIEAVVNGAGFSGSYTASASEYVWPWIITDDGSAIRPSNYEKHSSSAMISTKVTLGSGQVFAFDLRYAIEYDTYGTQLYDMLAVYIDGHIAQKVYGRQQSWTTLYAYTPDALTEGEHEVTLAYVKDSSDGYRDFTEFVEVKNIRVVTLDDMIAAGGSMNVLRFAAYGKADEGASTEYKNYATVVLNEKDGFYHVGTADGPILLAKLCGSTQWSPTSLADWGSNGRLVIDGIDYADSINKSLTRSYCWLEENSDLGYSVVDETLAELLMLFVENVGDGKNHPLEWLELCSYFDHYGKGDGITSVTDVRSGIDDKSAFDAVLGKNHAVIDRVIVPRGHYFRFVPDKTGVYSFYSLSKIGEGDDAAIISDIDTIAWLYDDAGNVLDESLDDYMETHFRIYHTSEAGKTYYIAVGFDPVDDLGEFDFMIEYVGEKLDVLTTCTEHYTTTADGNTIIIDRRYNFHAALGNDGYYHQVLGYEKDGTPILDMSETGYVYVDFKNVTIFTSMIPWPSEYCTLEKFIKGRTANIQEDEYDEENDKYISDVVKYELGTFDFTDYGYGNYQDEMLEYLADATSMDESDELYGYVKADDRLVEILDIFTKLYGEKTVEEQWLMMASFYRHV